MMKQDQHTRDLLDEIALSIDAKAFFSGDVGQAIMEKADAGYKAAFEKWLVSDPTDAAMQTQLLFEARVVDRLRNWLYEIISEGEQAEEYLLNRDKDEIDE